jgi:hypothetical protein
MSICKITKVILGCAISTGVSFGATAVARVISTDPVEVDGISMPARNFAPVAIGDEVATQGGSAVVQFQDGSNVTLHPKSRIRIEGKPAKLQVRILIGSANSNIVPTSRLHLVNSRGDTISQIILTALPTQASLAHAAGPLAPEVLYTSSSLRQSGGLAPGTSVAVGQFSGSGTFHAEAGGTATITAPNGTVITLAATTNPTTGAVTYTVQSITVQVTLPGGGTSTVTITSGSLIGANVGVTGSTTTGSQVSISITPSGGGTTLTPTQITQGIQQGVSQQSPGSTVSNPSPVTTGSFSGQAS